MPVNAGYEYAEAEKKFLAATVTQEKINALKEMLSKCPTHKGAENLRKEIKKKLSKYKEEVVREKKSKGGKTVGLKKEGVATVVLVGSTNSGKSTLLSQLTNAKPMIADYEFTTKNLEVGVMDYKGLKVQVVEIPAITKDFHCKDRGPYFLGIIGVSNLIVLMYKNELERSMILDEIEEMNVKILEYNKRWNIEEVKEKIWEGLNLIYIHTKQPGKKPEFPPVALKKGSTVFDLAKFVQKDFVKRFEYARIWGSAKHGGIRCGLDYKLSSGDIVEFHIK